MKLAKPQLDVGIFTETLQPNLEFWGQRAGLEFDHRIDLRGDWAQHRFKSYGSIVKINHLTSALPQRPPTGYVGITIATDRCAPSELTDPSGINVKFVPPGQEGGMGVGVTVRTSEPERMMDFYTDAMQFDRVDETTARCGESFIFVEAGDAVTESDDFFATGFRYLTVQVFDADREMAGIISRGGRFGREPVSLGDIARYGFVRDPDGNWIEMSARKSLISK